MESSYWFREIPDTKRFPSLEGNLRVDTAIIGGGIAGVSAAYHLSEAGITVALLEAGNLITGDSGFTTAFATHFLDSIDATIKAWGASDAGIQLFKEIIAREKISCDWEDVDGVEFTQKEKLDDFRKDRESLKAGGIELEYAEGNPATTMVGFPVRAAMKKPKSEGQFHIRKFLLPLAERAAAKGVTLFEESEVLEITPGETIKIKTTNGLVESARAIIASGPPLPQAFPELFKSLKGAITYVLHVRYPAAQPFGRMLLWDDLEPYHYLRWVNENELVLGGEDRYLQEKQKANPHDALAAWLSTIAPEAKFEVLNKWQGSLFYTPDVLPYAGAHPDHGENIIFLTGWAGNGMAHGLLGGKIAADLVQQKENPYAKIFDPNRLILYS